MIGALLILLTTGGLILVLARRHRSRVKPSPAPSVARQVVADAGIAGGDPLLDALGQNLPRSGPDDGHDVIPAWIQRLEPGITVLPPPATSPAQKLRLVRDSEDRSASGPSDQLVRDHTVRAAG